MKSLNIGVGRDELNALNLRLDHAVDGGVAAASDADDFNFRERFDGWFHLGHMNVWCRPVFGR